MAIDLPMMGRQGIPAPESYFPPAPQQHQGGLGGLGGAKGFLRSDSFGDLLQAFGASMLSSPSNAPFSGFAPALNAFQGQTAERRKLEAAEAEKAAAENQTRAWLVNTHGLSPQEADAAIANQSILNHYISRAKEPDYPNSYDEFLLAQENPAYREHLDTRRPGTTINMPGQPNIGSIPQGFQAIQDPETGTWRMERIPGGPEDTTKNEAVQLDMAMTASDVVTTAAQRARDAVADQNFGSAGTTTVANIPVIGSWTDSAEVVRNVNTLKAQAVASNLQAMRDASPTGGALGQVTNPELVLLANKSGALDPNSPTFLRDLADYERTLLRTIHGREAGDAIFEATRRDAEPTPQGGNSETGDLWEFMTPEERALFQ